MLKPSGSYSSFFPSSVGHLELHGHSKCSKCWTISSVHTSVSNVPSPLNYNCIDQPVFCIIFLYNLELSSLSEDWKMKKKIICFTWQIKPPKTRSGRASMDDHILSSIQLPIVVFPAVAYLREQLVAGFVFSSLYFNNKKRNLLFFLDGVGIWLLLSHSRIIAAP